VNEGLYIGTDAGVYYYDNSLTSWAGFSNALPNVVIDELEIQSSAGKLRAATFGRGLWECNLYDPASTTPLVNFVADRTSVCPGDSVQFTDLSSNSPSAWSWIFPGGTPASSNLQNPVIYYDNAASVNDVQLFASNANGTDSLKKFSYIQVSPAQIPTITLTNNDTICSNQSVQLIASNGQSYLWSNGAFNNFIHPLSSGDFYVTVTDAFGCAATSDTVNIMIYPAPSSPVISYQGPDTMCSSYVSGNQWYFNGNPIANDTTQCILITQPGNYYCVYSDAYCSVQSNTLLGVNEQAENNFHLSVSPDPNNGQFILFYELKETGDALVEVRDVTGRMVYSESLKNIFGKQTKTFDLNDINSGVYSLTLTTAKGRAVKKMVIY
jgi:PKD repeat protein